MRRLLDHVAQLLLGAINFQLISIHMTMANS